MKKNSLIILLVAIYCSSCSLLKVDVSLGDEPMTKTASDIRTASRSFHGKFCSEIIASADSIIAQTNNLQTKLNATRWKLHTTMAATSGVYQTDPNIAMLSIWTLCCRMNSYMQQAPDSLVFGEYSDIARSTATMLLHEVSMVAQRNVPKEVYAKMQDFVNLQCSTSPDIIASNLGFAWNEYTKQDSTAGFESSAGSISQVMGDMTERFTSQLEQYSNALTWSKDMFELRFNSDTTNVHLMAQLDALARDFNRMSLIIAHTPELVDRVSSDLNKNFVPMIENMNSSINTAFESLDAQRGQLQEFISAEREIIIKDATIAAQATVDKALEQIPSMITKLLFAFVAVFVILFSLPFALGYIIGKNKGKKKFNG